MCYVVQSLFNLKNMQISPYLKLRRNKLGIEQFKRLKLSCKNLELDIRNYSIF